MSTIIQEALNIRKEIGEARRFHGSATGVKMKLHSWNVEECKEGAIPSTGQTLAK